MTTRTRPQTPKPGTVRAPCPRCHYAPVSVSLAAWTESGQPQALPPRRSAWVDEPMYCKAGCRLSQDDVRRVLLGAFRDGAGQLRLPLEEETA